MRRRMLLALFLRRSIARAGFALAALFLFAHGAFAQLKISQVYGGGGGSSSVSSPFQRDYVELYNPTGAAVTMTSWALQSASATGTAWTAITLNGTVPANGYFLIGLTTATAAQSPALPTPVDATGTLDIGNTTAATTTGLKLALTNNTTLLSGANPISAAIQDFVGIGTTSTGSEPQGSFNTANNAPPLTNNTAIQRAGCGGTDSNVNAADFAVTWANPRNTATPPNLGVSAFGSASPNLLRSGDSVRLVVTPYACGSSAPSLTASVTANLTSIGGGAAVSLLDDGTGGDEAAGDGLYSVTATVTAAAGTVQIPVVVTDGASSGGTYLSILVNPVATPANDNCSTAQVITGPYTTPVSVNGNLTGALTEFNGVQTSRQSAWTSGMGGRRGLWYQVTGTGTTLTADLCTTAVSFDSVMMVFGGTCENLTWVADGDDQCGSLSSASWCTVAGAPYWVWVASFSTGAVTNAFTLRISDNGTACSGAAVVSVCAPGSLPPATSTENEAGFGPATDDGCDSSPNFFQAIAPTFPAATVRGSVRGYGFTRDTDWYRFQALTNDTLTVTLTGQFQGLVQVRQLSATGTCSTNTTLATSAISDRCASVSSTVSVTAGNWYAIRVNESGAGPGGIFGGVFPAGTSYFYTLSAQIGGPPVNDNCAGALAAVCGGSVNGDTTFAAADATPACGPANSSKGVWYTVSGTGFNITASTCDPLTTYDTRLTVFTGTCGSLSCVVDNDDDGTCANPTRSTVVFATIPGQTYYILVSGKSAADFGPFKLNLTCPNYCSSASTSLSFEYIQRVQLNTLDNTPAGTPHGNYTFYNLSTNVGQTNSYPITVTIFDPFSADRCTVYCDWNQNLTLNDPGEVFQLNAGGGPSGTTFSGTITVPGGALLGTTRMRVAMGDTSATAAFSPTNPCGTFTFGEVEDYLLNVVNAPPTNDDCSGALTVACGGGTSGNTTNALVDVVPGCGPAPVANGVWYKVAGTGYSITATTCDPLTTYDTRLTVYSGTCGSVVCVGDDDDDGTCANPTRSTVTWTSSLGTDYYLLVSGKTAVDVGQFALNVSCVNYCSATSTDSTSTFEYVTRVQLDGVDNSPGGTGQDHYTNYVPTEIVSLSLCSAQPITVTIANPFSTDRCTVWIDWNGDLDFTDPGEMFQLNGGGGPIPPSGTSGTFSGTINVPAGATLGSTRMRVSMGDTGSGVLFNPTNPCGTFQYGEVEDYGVSIAPDLDTDGDGSGDCTDGCPNDPNKVAPGVCGCGVSDVDSDSDGTPDCNDGCPNDPNKIVPGVCGCGFLDTDSDGDGFADCIDGCPLDPLKVAPGACGCGIADTDSDGDSTPDCVDGCPSDPLKIAPGVCGCGIADTDTDGDGTPNCIDGCPNDPNKTSGGQCGCGVADTDSDSDGTANCNDGCPNDPLKIAPGTCGCGVPDVDSDGDGLLNCLDNCPNVANPSQTDVDGDLVGDACDNCPLLPNPGQADCDNDGIGDVCAIAGGAPDCNLNGVPDSCDLAGGGSQDQNANNIPDECEQNGGSPFCFGMSGCPCGNNSTHAEAAGCRNSSGFGGKLLGTGNTSVASDGLVLNASHLTGSLAVFFQGNALVSLTYGDGHRCMGGSLKRIGKKNPSGGNASYPQGADPAISVKGLVPPGGGVRYYQVVYRNNGGPCGSGFNVTNGVSVVWEP